MATRDTGGEERQSRAERIRLFAAVDVPDGVQALVDAAVSPLRASAPGVKWTAPQSWHFTVAFLGWVEAERVADAEQALAVAAAASTPFELALSGTAGTFGTGVLWAGVERAPGLALLAARAADELRSRGFDIEERRFNPHLTLARARRGDRIGRGLAHAYAGPALSWHVEELVLFRSRLERRRAQYSVWAQWRLGERPGCT